MTTRPDVITPGRAFAASVLASAVLLAPAVANAGHENVQKTITKGTDPHLIIGEAWVKNLSDGRESWDDFSTSEQSLVGPAAGWSVCNYQGGWRIQNPDGSPTAPTRRSDRCRTSGCLPPHQPGCASPLPDWRAPSAASRRWSSSLGRHTQMRHACLRWRSVREGSRRPGAQPFAPHRPPSVPLSPTTR